MRAAAIQLTATEHTGRNRDTAERLVRAAADAGAGLVVLPEHFVALGPPDLLRESAEPLDGPTVGWARGLAQELAIELVAGSFVERAADGERLFNTSVHVGAGGDVRGVYRKVHTFDVDVAGRSYRASEYESAGEQLVVSHTADGLELGMSVCYDLRFPELYRILAVRGARVLLVPSAFTLPTTRDHWEPLLRARAIENQAFVVAPNQIGVAPGGYESGGRSMIIDPWGVVLAQAGDGELAIHADLDLDRLVDIRSSLPSLRNRRPGAYAWPDRDAAPVEEPAR